MVLQRWQQQLLLVLKRIKDYRDSVRSRIYFAQKLQFFLSLAIAGFQWVQKKGKSIAK